MDNLDRGNPRRSLGFGAPRLRKGMGVNDPDVKRFIGRVAQDLRNPSYYIPVIESVTIHYGGPLTPQQVDSNFGSQFSPFFFNKQVVPPGVLSIQSSFVDPGKCQVDTLICGISFTVEPDPVVFTAKGNVFTKPTVGTRKRVSPDFYTANDLVTVGGFNALGMVPGEQVAPAYLDWAGWTEQAFYYMVRAYALQWQMGSNHLLLNQDLRYVAYMPSNAQEGSASSSEQDVEFYARRANDYYENNLGSLFEFSPIDRTRVGSFTAAGQNVGNFRPSRAYETAGATYGAMGLRAYIKGNTEILRLSAPYLMPKGVAIGLQCQVNEVGSLDYNLMKAYFSSTFGFAGVTPPVLSEDVNVTAGFNTAGPTPSDLTFSTVGGANTGNELTLDATPVPVPQQVPSGRVPIKGGPFKIRMAIRGWELDDATSAAVRDPDITAAIQRECGCAFQFSQ
jgi:hypothetical protein